MTYPWLWRKPEIIEILKERERVLEVLGNNAKDLEIAGRLKAKRFDDEFIADASGLPLEEITQL